MVKLLREACAPRGPCRRLYINRKYNSDRVIFRGPRSIAIR